MTFKPSVKKVFLRTTSTPQIERLCGVTGTLPSEVRVAFEKRNQTVAAETEGTATEKLMPCRMRYPEPFRARPNFFIPILTVSSYVVPFFMLLYACQNFHSPSLITNLEDALGSHTGKIYIPRGLPRSLFDLFLIMLPMLVGGLTAYALSKNNRLGLKQKMVLWLVSVCLVIAVVIFSPAFFTQTEPYPARAIDSTHY